MLLGGDGPPPPVAAARCCCRRLGAPACPAGRRGLAPPRRASSAGRGGAEWFRNITDELRPRIKIAVFLTRWIKRVVLFNTAPRGVHLNPFIDKRPHSLWNMQFYIFRCLLPNLYQKRIRHIFEVSLREKAIGTFTKNAYFQRPRSREPGIPRGRPAQSTDNHT